MKTEMGELRKMIAELLKRGGGGGAVQGRSAEVIAGGGARVLEDGELARSENNIVEKEARGEEVTNGLDMMGCD